MTKATHSIDAYISRVGYSDQVHQILSVLNGVPLNVKGLIVWGLLEHYIDDLKDAARLTKVKPDFVVFDLALEALRPSIDNMAGEYLPNIKEKG